MANKRSISKEQWGLVIFILALVFVRVGYSLLSEAGLRQSAALFIGLPAALAILISLTPRPRSVTGMILKGLTIVLFMSGILLLEGLVCIIMAAPLFYGVGIAIGLAVDFVNEKGPRTFILLPILLMSLEGTSEALSFNRHETVTVQQRVSASSEEIEDALAREPDFDEALPPFLQLGFPRPVYAHGSGLQPGDLRTIGFAVGRQGPYEMVLEVVESRPGFAEFRVVRDDTPVSGWLRLEQSTVKWEGSADGESTLSWTMEYERELDPAWYFAPMQRYAVELAAEYLIEAVATP